MTPSYDGETLASEATFTPVLDGLMSSARLGIQHCCNASHAASKTRQLVLRLLITASETMPPSYLYVRRAFRFLALEMVIGDKYAKVEFELTYDWGKIGEGFVRFTPLLDDGMSGMASKRRSIKRRGDFLSARYPGEWTL